MVQETDGKARESYTKCSNELEARVQASALEGQAVGVREGEE